MKIDQKGRLTYSYESFPNSQRPSIDVMFSSAADYFGSATMGILLTGMGKDGATGLLAIARAGGITVAQDEDSSIVFGMPREAINLGAAKYILSPDEISQLLIEKFRGSR